MAVKERKKKKNTDLFIDLSDYDFPVFNANVDSLDSKLKGDLEAASDESYREITEKIVNTSTKQLFKQNESKESLKTQFTKFFKVLLSFQLISIFIIAILKGFCSSFDLSDTVYITLITSVFVETLGVVSVMVKYAYDSKQEIEILSILNSVVKNFQKYREGKK